MSDYTPLEEAAVVIRDVHRKLDPKLTRGLHLRSMLERALRLVLETEAVRRREVSKPQRKTVELLTHQTGGERVSVECAAILVKDIPDDLLVGLTEGAIGKEMMALSEAVHRYTTMLTTAQITRRSYNNQHPKVKKVGRPKKRREDA